MAKQSKKGKNELDVILEQLKKSYGSNSPEALEDDLLENADAENEDDIELNEILNSLFASETKSDEAESHENEKSDISVTNDFVDNQMSQASSDTSIDENIDGNTNTDQSELCSDAETDTAPMIDESIEDDDTDEAESSVSETVCEDPEEETEKIVLQENDKTIDLEAYEQVDNVISTMLGNKAIATFENDLDSIDNSDNEDLSIDEADISNIDDEANETNIETFILDTDNGIADIKDIDQFSDTDIDESVDYEFSLSEESDDDIDENDDFAVEDEEYDITGSDDENTVVYEESSSEDISTERNAEASDPDISDQIQTYIKPRLVLSPEEYIFDPLQNLFPSFSLQNYEENIENEPLEPIIDYSKANDSSFDNNDISLLLKFGYDNEIKSKVGYQKTQEVILEQDSKFDPDKYQKPFGYCGSELTDRNQIPKITEKYKSNKLSLIILLAIASVVSLFIFAVDIFFVFFSERIEFFPFAVLFEFIFIITISLLLYNKIASGFMGIIKFEPNRSTLFAFLVIYYTLYQAVSMAMYITDSSDLDYNNLMVFGGFVSLYAITDIVADLVICIKESNTFSLIASSNDLYIAEKQSSSSVKHTRNIKNSYKLKKAGLVSGYFKKISSTKINRSTLIYIIGVVPILSLISGGAVALCSGNIIFGLSFMMLTALLSIPLFEICIQPIADYIMSRWLRNYDSSFIGSDAIYELSDVDRLVFKDTDSIEVSTCTEIRPAKSPDSQNNIEIAYDIFRAFGGPLASICPDQTSDDKEYVPKIIINDMTENGIDVYYNDSVNILLGDKYYMQTHKIKVKTDTNLTAAVKGVDRSVIYMAFDGVPKLGFIINSKIKGNFADVCGILNSAAIKVAVETYEPQINDIYFDQNKHANMPQVATIKPSAYERSASNEICNTYVVSASSSINVAKSIVLSKKFVEKKKWIKLMSFIVSGCGILISALLTFLYCYNSTSNVGWWISDHFAEITSFAIILELIPAIAQSIYLIYKKPTEDSERRRTDKNERKTK